MSRETLNLLVAELPGTDKAPEGDRDVWSAADRAFARVGDDGIEVMTDGGWVAAGSDPEAARPRVVEAYERLRDLLPPEEQPRLDRTSG